MFGEILGLRALFNSVFPFEAIPSHADLGLERGNSHSCLSDVPSPQQEGRAHLGAERRSRGPKVLILGLASRQQAGIHVAGLAPHPTFSKLGRETLDTICYQQLGLREDFSTR